MTPPPAPSNVSAREEAMARLAAIVDSTDDAIYSRTLGGIVTSWNGGAERMFGYRSVEMVGCHLTVIVPNERLWEIADFNNRLTRGERIKNYETVRVAKGGRKVPVSLTLSPILAADGSVAEISIIGRDITETKEIEKALKESMLKFRRMTDALPQIVWTAEPDGSLDYLNAFFEAYTGISGKEGAPGTDFQTLLIEIFHPDDVERTSAAWFQSVASGTPFQHENRIKNRYGAYRWHLNRAVPDRDDQGKIVKWYGTSADIHDLREMQEKLLASETRFRWLYESNLVAIFFWNSDGKISDANQAFCDLIGYSAEECRAAAFMWREITSPESRLKDQAAMEEAAAHGVSRPYEKSLVNQKNGERVEVLTAVASMMDAQEEGIGFAVDLTDLKRAEKALIKSESTLKLAIETTELGIFDLDLASGKGEWSAIAKGHYGLPPNADLDLTLALEAMNPEDRPRLERVVADAKSARGSGAYNETYRVTGIGDKEERWLSMRARVSHDAEGNPARLTGACLNITETILAHEKVREEMAERLQAVEDLRRQEQLLIRQGRLAAMGEMIANIAHQWRQPLNTLGLIIQEFPAVQQRGLLTPEYLDAAISRAMQVINYMSQTIDGFRNFFGPDKEKQTFHPAEILEKTVAILDAAFAELNLELKVQADPEAVIYGTPNEYSQVILNILMNAKDALIERRVEDPTVKVRLFREKGRTVLTVEDNAGGIPDEIFEKIFDPYFTTKGPDRGTGIGLFMSKTIIEKNMNGRLSVRNTDAGAEFRIEV